MKLFAKSALTALVIAAPSFAFATEYDIDSAHSSANFAVKHLMVSTVRGSFSKVTGTINLDEKDLTKSSVNASIDASTVNTQEPKRDEHLRSPDFFDVTKFPSLTFKSTKVEKGGNGFKVSGDLTIHGVTKPVVLDVEGFNEESKDPWGNLRRGGSATTTVSRKDFGLVWNKALETGGVAVGDEVKITIDIEGVKKQMAPATAPAAAPAKKK
jgi:polyisoprenoid-binding protein YceI